MFLFSTASILDKKYNQVACLQHNTVKAACALNMAGTAHSASRKLQNEQNPKYSIEQNKRDNCVFIIVHHKPQQSIYQGSSVTLEESLDSLHPAASYKIL